MYYELSKSQKKIARKIMDKGLENHYIRALTEAEVIIEKWHSGIFMTTREAYINLYQCIEKNDNNIARIYNDKGGSRWVEVIAAQLADGVITIADLNNFDEEVRNSIIKWSRI